VFLDARSIGLGASLAWLALQWAPTDRPHPWSTVFGFAAGIAVVLAGFLHLTARFGGTWEEGPYTLHSRLTREDYRARDTEASRAALGQTSTLRYDDYLRRFEDEPWFYEVRVHVYRRDRYVQKGDWNVACAEHRILTRLAPVALQGTAYAWGPAQEALCSNIQEVRYVSPVGDDLLTSFTPVQMWSVAGVAAVFLGSLAAFSARRPSRR
jgi:hypothetical protein